MKAIVMSLVLALGFTVGCAPKEEPKPPAQVETPAPVVTEPAKGAETGEMTKPAETTPDESMPEKTE